MHLAVDCRMHSQATFVWWLPVLVGLRGIGVAKQQPPTCPALTGCNALTVSCHSVAGGAMHARVQEAFAVEPTCKQAAPEAVRQACT